MNKKTKIKVTEWKNCYPSNWRGLIVSDALKHPAKYSSLLIAKIYDHMIEEGWVTKGSKVIDPFGGVALGALHALRLGLIWRGVELEPHFVKTGGENISLWNSRFGNLPNWSGDAILLNGDSRNLVKILSGIQNVAISSPPFGKAAEGGGIAKSIRGESDYPMDGALARVKKAEGASAGFGYQGQGDTSGNLSTLPISKEGLRVSLALSSPPYADSIKPGTGSGFDYSKSKGAASRKKTAGRESIAVGYGNTEGNLGKMSAENFELSVSSPPFLQTTGGTKVSRGMDSALVARHAAGNAGAHAYGKSDGQMSSLPEGDFHLAVASPPFQKGSEGVMRASKFKHPERFIRIQAARGNGASLNAKRRQMKTDEEHATYGETDGNIANDSPGDFWMLARVIIEQTYLALGDGGHAVWVVKDFVKGGKIVPFADQWRQLCEAVGFVTLHEHHALFAREKGTSKTLDGKDIKNSTTSKSFFRRVTERNAALNSYYETLDEETKSAFISQAARELKEKYESLSEGEKLQKDASGELINEPPKDKSILKYAKEIAFSQSGEDLADWNRHVAIDYEVVFCMEKRS